MEEPRFVDWERGMLACARRCLVLPLLIALVVPPASAQDLRVRVIDEFSGSPVPGALVTVFDSVGWAVDRRQTGATGTFAVAPPVPGTYQIWTTGLGYEPLLSRAVRIDPATSEVEIRLRPKPLEMEPVRATVAAQRRALRAVGFYHRLQIGVGRFITAEDPELRDAIKVTDALRMEPSVHIVPDRGGPAIIGSTFVFRNARRGFDEVGTRACLPSLVIDGTQVRRSGPLPGDGRGDLREIDPVRLDDLVHPADIAAIELYPSGSGAPVEWSSTAARCGVVVVWTRWSRP